MENTIFDAAQRVGRHPSLSFKNLRTVISCMVLKNFCPFPDGKLVPLFLNLKCHHRRSTFYLQLPPYGTRVSLNNETHHFSFPPRTPCRFGAVGLHLINFGNLSFHALHFTVLEACITEKRGLWNLKILISVRVCGIWGMTYRGVVIL